jgi:hypothetical protein
MVAHSYGTFMASRLVQRRRSAVASLTLLDPVCFIMYNGACACVRRGVLDCLGVRLLVGTQQVGIPI